MRLAEGSSLVTKVSNWSLIAALPMTWLFLGAMLVVWWWQHRGPLWQYPWIWMLMALLFGGGASVVGVLSFIALAALWFPSVRRGLVPPDKAPSPGFSCRTS